MALPPAANRGKMNGVLNLLESRKRGYQNRTGCGMIYLYLYVKYVSERREAEPWALCGG